MQLLVHGGGTAVVLWPYQRAKHCLTRKTVHSDVGAASTVLQHLCTLVNWRVTCEWCTGAVLARSSMVTIVTCVVTECLTLLEIYWKFSVSWKFSRLVCEFAHLSLILVTILVFQTAGRTAPHTVHLVCIYAHRVRLHGSVSGCMACEAIP